MRVFSICLSDIPKDKIRTADNGKKYASFAMWENDEPDRFGNDFSIQMSKTKEEREMKVKTVYVGNGKYYGKDRPEPKQQTTHISKDDEVINPGDDLPF